MKASAWIDKVKAAHDWPSDYRVAKELGFKPNTISNYRVNGTPMDEEIAIKVAHALNVDPAIVLADQAMERTKSEEARTAWAEIIQRLGGVAAGLFVAVGMGVTPAPSSAATTVSEPGMYIMLRRKRGKKSRSGLAMLNCWPFAPLIPGSKRLAV